MTYHAAGHSNLRSDRAATLSPPPPPSVTIFGLIAASEALVAARAHVRVSS